MREILFRGKTEYGKWVEGYYYKAKFYVSDKELCGFITTPYPNEENRRSDHIIVIPETVGQYTGLTDKNGKKIFEGDIVKGLFRFSMPVNSIVSFNDGAFGLLWYREGVETFWAFTSICNVEYEVIGNIHDNPELLEVE